MQGVWLTQEELDGLCNRIGQLKYVEALPLIQIIKIALERGQARSFSRDIGDNPGGTADVHARDASQMNGH